MKSQNLKNIEKQIKLKCKSIGVSYDSLLRLATVEYLKSHYGFEIKAEATSQKA